MALKCNTPCDADGVCPYGASFDGNVDCEFFCGKDEPQDNPAIWDDGEDISENSTTEYGDEPTTEYSENSKEGKTMTINAMINGTIVPVEVTEEELTSKGFFIGASEDYKDEIREDAKREVKEAIFDELVYKMDLTERQADLLSSGRDWEFFKNDCTDLDDEDFAEKVINGGMLNMMNEKAEELAPKEKYFEFEVDVVRTIKQRQTVTITIKAEDEDDASDKLECADYWEIEDVVSEYDWETDDEDDEMIDGWHIVGEREDEGDNYIVL